MQYNLDILYNAISFVYKRKKIKLVVFLFLFCATTTEIFSQGKINFIGGADLSGNTYTYARHRKVLRTGDYDVGLVIYNLNGALQYKPTKSFSLEFGIQLVEFVNQCVDTAFILRHPESRKEFLNLPSNNSNLTTLAFDKYYTCYYITGTKYFPISERFSFYTSLGLSRNHVHRGTTLNGVNTFYDAKNNETLQLKYHGIDLYLGGIGEAGITLQFWKRFSWTLGCRYNTTFTKVIKADYTDSQNGTIVNTDHLFTRGTYLGAVFRLGITLVSSDKLNPQIHHPHLKFPKIRIPRIRLPKISIPRISLPKINFDHSYKSKRKNKKIKRKNRFIMSPRYLIQE